MCCMYGVEPRGLTTRDDCCAGLTAPKGDRGLTKANILRMFDDDYDMALLRDVPLLPSSYDVLMLYHVLVPVAQSSQPCSCGFIITSIIIILRLPNGKARWMWLFCSVHVCA